MIKRKRWTPNEIEIIKQNYHKGVNLVKTLLPDRTKRAIIKKAKSLNLKSDRTNYDLDELKSIVSESYSYADVFRKLKKSKSGDSYSYLRRFIIKNNIDISHFDPWKNNGKFQEEININDYLVIGSKITSSHLKKKLYKNNLKERMCEKCGQGEEWQGEKMSLILDHINGVNNDNRLENLRILCPNCNATLPTHCRGSKALKKKESKKISNKNKAKIVENKKSKKKKTLKGNKVCERSENMGFTKSELEGHKNQRKVERPSYEQLLKELEESNWTQVGNKYGVSDNAVRKWIRMYEKHGHNY